MKRNRSIRTLPSDSLNLQHPLPDEKYFGEEITLSDDSDLFLIRDFGSSSSSLSWGDECKSELSKKVKDELERMDRVLMGLEPIPNHYDKEEYEEWMELFPNLCVFGHQKPICDKKGLFNCDNNRKMTLNDEIDTYLKVTSMSSKLNKRQTSSRSLISSQISSSKWLKDDFDSLPFLVNVKSERVQPKSILKNTLVLPPIDGTSFRSISATPRRDTKSLSALGDHKYSGFKRKN